MPRRNLNALAKRSRRPYRVVDLGHPTADFERHWRDALALLAPSTDQLVPAGRTERECEG